MKKIRIIAMDVDGTLTDGGIYIGEKGEVMKRFCAKDGYAIHDVLPEIGIIPVVVTGRVSDIVRVRCHELNIHHLIQGSKNKVKDLKVLCRELGCSIKDVAYIGDDLNDLMVMKCVGLRGCPADAVQEIISISDFISTYKGGDGAVREFIDWIACSHYDRK